MPIRIKVTAVFDAATVPDLRPLQAVALDMKTETISEDVGRKQVPSIARLPRGTTMRTAIMEHYGQSATFNDRTALAWVRKHQPMIKDQSLSPALSTLAKDGYIKRLAQGEYQFVKRMANVHIIGESRG